MINVRICRQKMQATKTDFGEIEFHSFPGVFRVRPKIAKMMNFRKYLTNVDCYKCDSIRFETPDTKIKSLAPKSLNETFIPLIN